ncbi:MAG TPA: AmmeMemoRadiSam system protein A [Thermoanaerobaculia bacterium]|nr:AmmeMemoRadiSam system protein A [Thermoanaerobaculia bacterium]
MTTVTETPKIQEERGKALVRIARESLAEALGLGTMEAPDEPWLHEKGATFVTLTANGKLRGCMGSIRARRTLLEDVQANARSAAFDDPRFLRVRPAEFVDLSVEVSLLSPPEPFEVESEEDALAHLRPGVDGVVLECGTARSTFLPQVWEQLPDPRKFLAHLKVKAGLPADFWSPEIRLSRYTVEKFKDDPK